MMFINNITLRPVPGQPTHLPPLLLTTWARDLIINVVIVVSEAFCIFDWLDLAHSSLDSVRPTASPSCSSSPLPWTSSPSPASPSLPSPFTFLWVVNGRRNVVTIRLWLPWGRPIFQACKIFHVNTAFLSTIMKRHKKPRKTDWKLINCKFKLEFFCRFSSYIRVIFGSNEFEINLMEAYTVAPTTCSPQNGDSPEIHPTLGLKAFLTRQRKTNIWRNLRHYKSTPHQTQPRPGDLQWIENFCGGLMPTQIHPVWPTYALV